MNLESTCIPVPGSCAPKISSQIECKAMGITYSEGRELFHDPLENTNWSCRSAGQRCENRLDELGATYHQRPSDNAENGKKGGSTRRFDVAKRLLSTACTSNMHLKPQDVTPEQLLQCADTLLALLSQIVCNGTKLRGFPLDFGVDFLKLMDSKLTLAMSYFNTLRNGQSLACLLPPEILNSIFSLTSNVFSDFSSRPLEAARREESFDWHPMCLSGVCRYWKAVALSFPSIWSTIDICDEDECPSSSSIDIAKLCLRRSYNGCVDVHISCPIPKAELPWITEILASQSIRFRGFHIYGFSFGPEILQHFAEDPAPELQSLTISPQGDFSHGSDIVLPMLFAGYTPRLRHLVLKHITSWPGNDFSNLRSLRLEDQVAPCPISEFLDFLHHSPHLEDLILVCAGPSEADPAVQLRQLSLPRLRQLILKECPAICQATRILPFIQPSPTVAIMIDRTYHNNSLTTGSNIARCNTLLATMSRFTSMPNITRLLLDTFSSFDRGLGSHKLRLTGTGLSSFDICPSADFHEMASNQYMAAAIGLISACNIQELWIGSDHVIQKDYIWQRLLFAMPSLKKIVLGPWDSHTPGCLLALHTPDESVGRALPCPSLEELVILGRLGENKWPCEAVQKLLVNRKTRGFPVRRVVLVRRTLDTVFDPYSTADGFREIVEDVETQSVLRYPTMEGSEAARALGRYF